MSNTCRWLVGKHEKTAWVIHDPNGEVATYRPLKVGPEGLAWEDCLYIGNAAKDKSVLALAQQIVRHHNNTHAELLQAANNLLAYRHCLTDGAGRDFTNAGIDKALTALTKAAKKAGESV